MTDRRDNRSVVIHVVRHCDVENPGGLIYGRLNGFRLSSLGRQQAIRLGEYFARRDLGAVYSSPLLRAIQTARAIGAHHPHLVVRPSALITEVRTAYQGLRSADVPPSINMFDNPREPTDETMADVARRMTRFLSRSIREATSNGWSEVVCVSHAAPIGILRTGLEGLPLVVSSLRGPREPDKGSVTSLTYRGDELATMSYETLGTPSVAAIPS